MCFESNIQYVIADDTAVMYVTGYLHSHSCVYCSVVFCSILLFVCFFGLLLYSILFLFYSFLLYAILFYFILSGQHWGLQPNGAYDQLPWLWEQHPLRPLCPGARWHDGGSTHASSEGSEGHPPPSLSPSLSLHLSLTPFPFSTLFFSVITSILSK